MNGNYKETDLSEIVNDLVEKLKEYEDGTITSTSELLEKHGYHDLEFDDLFKLNEALLKTAKAKKIKLDLSGYEDKTTGLPFNLPFVVKKNMEVMA